MINVCNHSRMTICGEKREKFNNKHGTPYDVLQSTTMGAVLRIMERCHRKKRNYILDQANIYVNGHSKKMGPFEGKKDDLISGTDFRGISSMSKSFLIFKVSIVWRLYWCHQKRIMIREKKRKLKKVEER